MDRSSTPRARQETTITTTSSFPTLEELRVSKQEILSGTTSGRRVYVRLSPGAVAFPMERPVVTARVDRLIISKIEEEEVVNN
jgi:hypothetical protein